MAALEEFGQKLLWHQLDGMGVKQMVHYDKLGKPKRGHPSSRIVYHPQASLTLNVTVVVMHQQLCLLVYNLGQRQLRQTLQRANQTLPNQLSKATQRPTLRWVFQCFMAVHSVVLNGIQQVVNLTDEPAYSPIFQFCLSAVLLAVLKVVLIPLCQLKVRNMG